LLQLYYNDFYIFIPFLLNFIIYWAIFYKINFFNVQITNLFNDKINCTNINKNLHYIFFVKINQIFLIFMLIYFLLFRGYIESFWWNHFKISNFILYIYLILILVNLLYLHIIKVSSFNSGIYKIDYFFALTNLSNFLPIIFLTNTFFTFLFILEINSSLVFYKFVTSKFWYNDDKVNVNVNNFVLKRLFPKNYLNMLFFQYWANFFSSVMIMYVLISYLYIYGSTEWMFINILNDISLKINYFYNYFNNIILLVILLFAFLIKLGFTPIQLYKIEIYKGIPYIAIFFYTVYYFLVFFTFFILLIVYYLNSFLIYWWYLLLLILIIGGLYTLSLLFDINYIKAFFAYSTIINSLGFICIILSILI
jgi:hypothetical protein